MRFGVFECGTQSLRYIAMPLYHDSLQTYINSKPGKVIGLTDVYKILPLVLDAYDYLHSEVGLSLVLNTNFSILECCSRRSQSRKSHVSAQRDEQSQDLDSDRLWNGWTDDGSSD